MTISVAVWHTSGNEANISTCVDGVNRVDILVRPLRNFTCLFFLESSSIEFTNTELSYTSTRGRPSCKYVLEPSTAKKDMALPIRTISWDYVMTN